MALVDFALQYAARGWHVFALRPRSKIPLIGKAAGGKGFHDATTDPRTIEAWWCACPDANIGLATGASGLVVLDPDGPEGLAQLQDLTRQHGPLPRTLVSKTGREGGFHLIFSGTGVKSSQVKGEHLDVRGSSGYIVAPPSVHPSGAIYAWVDPQAGTTPLPDWVARWVATRKGARDTQVLDGRTGLPFAPGRGLAAKSVANLTRPSQAGKPANQEAARLRSALSVIDAAIDGATWFSFGAALHDLKWIDNGTDYGFEIWNEWSSTSKGDPLVAGEGGYKGRADLEKRWAGFDREYNGVRCTIATIFKAAMDLGWQGAAEPEKVNGNHALGLFPDNFNQARQAGSPAGGVIIWPDRDQWGKPKSTCRNARAAIRHMGLTCEHDTFHDKLIIGGQPIQEWAGELTDSTIHMLRVTIERRYNIDPGTGNTLDAAVQECLQGGFDPVADYLDGLTWDGVPRLRTWLPTYLGAADTALHQAIGGLMLVAAVRRIRSPGCKFDQILVLIGEEGKNKSLALETLAGAGNFSDQTILTLDDKGQQEALSGVWIYEIADLAGMSKADTEKVKAFASRRVDRARPAYARTRVDKPRRNILCASTNHSTFLKSQTGNRRFWPVEVGRIDLKALERDRDQLWAEASTVEARGVSLMLPEALWDKAGEAQRERLEQDPWEDILSAVTGKTDNGKGKQFFSPDGRALEARVLSQNLLQINLSLPPEKWSDVTAKRVAFIMRRLGWEGPKLLRDGEYRGRGFTRIIKFLE